MVAYRATNQTWLSKEVALKVGKKISKNEKRENRSTSGLGVAGLCVFFLIAALPVAIFVWKTSKQTP
jgi:hypothetical protein